MERLQLYTQMLEVIFVKLGGNSKNADVAIACAKIATEYYNEEMTALREEIEVTEGLWLSHKKVLDAIPECELHGSCIPHALDWIKDMKDIEAVINSEIKG